ncbi:hypothetical protein IU433_16255 [Nocardia puris]|uniref:Uncharacterized protein n=1 Tax=Nocardia puris TaxID=208602 RepID=A0A366DA84_9NOCA|nr:DUF6069 family protein [Nocardia puris]MBF6211765.1 hypothetical protein [Nocardia puris]MBF6365768.1 hypothetical protein [Nocardia puris]MBF6460589.1 hypothetical protein [Nocardia puris]RBO86943.1 hypothetical protein DFR74_112115 [Nocardia puris]
MTTTTANPASTGSFTDRIPALSRKVAVVGAVVGAVLVNLVIWLIGEAAGGSFTTVDGDTTIDVAPGGVIVLSAVPMAIGLTAAALLAYKWVGALRLAAVIGSALSLATIGLTVTTDFDTPSMVALSVMHVVLVPALVIATEGMRRKLLER